MQIHSCDVLEADGVNTHNCVSTQGMNHTHTHTYWNSFDLIKVKTSNKLYITQYSQIFK